MKKNILIALAVICLLCLGSANSDSFVYSVAARCTGEASFAVEGCAWTVYNRLEAGWVKSKVLNAYYAKSIRPTQKSINLVRPILDGTTEKENPGYYFMFSLQDVRYLGIEDLEPIGKVINIPNRSEIWFYERFYHRRK
jgi:hypothetical protein